MKLTTALERVAIVVASLALSFGLIALLSGFFAGRDDSPECPVPPPSWALSTATRAMLT